MRGKYSTVIAKFLKISKGSSNYLPVSKPGTQKRNFTHIDDIIEGLILVRLKKEKGMGKWNRIRKRGIIP